MSAFPAASKSPATMQLHVGYELVYDCPQHPPMVLMLNVLRTRAGDIVVPDRIVAEPFVPMTSYSDGFWELVHAHACAARPATAVNQYPAERHGRARLDGADRSSGIGEGYSGGLARIPPWRPICEKDHLTGMAWNILANRLPAPAASTPSVTMSIATSPSATRMPDRRKRHGKLFDGRGVCRDYAHLAIAFCRCMNIPAGYCTGYLGDIGIPPPYGPMDFAAWFKAYMGGRWHTFDARNNTPRIGRVLIARGRDATDVAISNTFGPTTLAGFTVWTDEVSSPPTKQESVIHRSHMRLLTVRRVTVYRCSEPVQFGEHRMMFRPRESRKISSLLRHEKLEILHATRICAGFTTSSTIRWPSPRLTNQRRELRFDSTVTLERIRNALPDYALEIGGTPPLAFAYSDDDRPNLVNALARHRLSVRVSLGPWTARFLPSSRDQAARPR